MESIFLVTALFTILAGNCEATAAGDTSRLQVTFPNSLRSEEGFDHREALFGLPPYGGTIEQNVYYADSTLCDPNNDYSHGGYPAREVDGSGKMAKWKTPFILMVDRGECDFVEKVRIAQRSGAVAVLIADNTCLCSMEDICQNNDDAGAQCESTEPLMADDGSGTDITIPSFLMFKQDADPIKEAIKVNNTSVRVAMSWLLPRPDSQVEYQLWTTPKDPVSVPLLKSFREVANALAGRARFTPHMYMYDGVFAGCHDSDGNDECFGLCTNKGRYCASAATDENGVTGADIVEESLRRICIWNEYGKDGVGMPWWNYIDEFLYRCDGKKSSLFKNMDCIKDAMKRAEVDPDRIDKCIETAGGLEDGQNTILDEELKNRQEAGVVILPSFFVNKAPLRGALTTGEVFEAICSAYAHGSEPTVCKSCLSCHDLHNCVAIGHCPGAKGSMDNVSVPVFAVSLLSVVVCFGALGFIQWRRSQNQMNEQMRQIMAEYKPIDKNQQVESVGLTDDDEEDDLPEFT
eukprot:scaffold1736_cov127-Cylindrotheca_fusiformis.AAC.63